MTFFILNTAAVRYVLTALVLASAVVFGIALERIDEPWFLQVILWPFLLIIKDRPGLWGLLHPEQQKSIMGTTATLAFRIVWVIAGFVVFFKYL